MKALATAFATFLGVGFFPVAPGTAATAAGIALVFLLQFSLIGYLAVLMVLLAVSIPVCSYLESTLNQKDPGIIVVDEVVGVMVALLGFSLSWPIVIIGFFLFRAFDMFKIYPINRFEALPGGWGIVLDDVMAGLYTNIALHVAVKYAGLI
jgi:phosphatidylglycerophosphatase A